MKLLYVTVLAYLATITQASPQPHIRNSLRELADRIRERARQEVNKEVRGIRNPFDDRPTHVVTNPGYANNETAFVSYFAYEPPKADDARDTYDGIFNYFRRFNLNSYEEGRLRERSYWIRGDYDETPTRLDITGSVRNIQTEGNGVVQQIVPFNGGEILEANSTTVTYKVRSLENGGQEESSYVIKSTDHEHQTLVISDVDDILKKTNTNSLTETLANTFWRPYEPIYKMPKVMKNLGANNNTSYHYVTGIPIVLSPPLIDWILSVYPSGSFTFRPATQLDFDSIKTTLQQGGYRRDAISRIIDTFPSRNAVIFGDTFGTSLQTTADLIEKYPNRHICHYVHRFQVTQSDEQMYNQIADDSDTNIDRVRNQVIFYTDAQELLDRGDLTQC